VIEIENITDEPIQQHSIILEDFEVILTLRFYFKSSMWVIDAEYDGKTVKGLKLSVGVLHMLSQNQPFDFEVTDNSGSGLDPFEIGDFLEGRCNLYMLERADMVGIRNGIEV